MNETVSKEASVDGDTKHVRFLHYIFLLEKIYRRELSSEESTCIFELAKSRKISDSTSLYDMMRLLEKLKKEN